MSSNNILRLKFIKLCLIPSVLILLLFLFLVSDSIVSKIHSPNVVNSCTLCLLKRNISNNNAELMHFTILSAENNHEKIDIMLIFVHAHRNLRLKNNFIQCISSLFIHTTSPLHLHILVDQLSVNNAIEILKKAAPLSRAETQVTLYDVNIFMKPLQNLIDTLRPHFSFKQGAYYGDALFYLSIGLYKIINFKQLILIDADVKFLNDVKYLYEEFNNFPTKALIGIAREQQPVYRHILSEYRTLHNDTQIGGPPPYGKTGFNSGVLLLYLEKMQNSTIYKNIIDNSSIILTLIKKYKFKGHLGDQDFYTLISLDHPSLFYEIPCTWNRQLCQWWKHHGYSNIFNLYHNCSGRINLLHGNCNTLIPVS